MATTIEDMTGATPSSPQVQGKQSPLAKALARELPRDFRCTASHLSTTPILTEALCYPPALQASVEKRQSKPLKTYCEKHFLTASIPNPTTAQDVLVLALEIYIYTTTFSTTIFVAKADSTGYLHLQSSPKGVSPIRAITAAFLHFLVCHRRRPTKQLVINLFARSQSQYIFPGSVKNDKKHILDDRGLIKWWCKVLNPLLEDNLQGIPGGHWHHRHAYLVIPGLDDYEARAFIPRTEHATHHWSLGHPLELISPYTKDPTTYGDVPPRCLIPTYPDDPKARFVEELEESTSERAKLLGGWKTPKTLDQFWEMMAFRQECSSGRMTGFVWLVFEPTLASTTLPERLSSAANPSPTTTTIPAISITSNDTARDANSPSASGVHDKCPESKPISSSKARSANSKTQRKKGRAKKVLKGPIIPRQPRVKTHRVKFPSQTETPYYYWPEAGRGQVVLDDNGYKRAVELLQNLEFKTLEQATASTSRWLNEVNMGENWALPVVGEKVVEDRSLPEAASGVINNLSGSIQKKRKSEDRELEASAPAPVNLLGGGLVRKRVKD